MEAGTSELIRKRASGGSRSSRRDAAVAILACAALALCFVVPFLPGFAGDELIKTSLWGLAVLASFAGWGTLIASRCAPGAKVGISLRAAWGASGFAFVGGLGAMVSGISRAALLVFLVSGAVLLAREWVVKRRALAHDLRARLRASTMNVPLAAVVGFLGVVVAIHYLGAASDVSSNPYDDDIAYYPFARQLLERGTLIDPFSFRRMSTLGGQALYHAALLVRVPMLHVNLFDRGMCLLLLVGLIASHRSGGRKAPVLARLVSVAFIAILPNTSINSASFYSGLAFFLAFYQSLEMLPESTFAPARTAAVRLLPLALTGAALCAQRQNYQATVGLVLLVSYGLAALRLRRRALRAVVVECVVCLLLLGVLVAPWLVLLYRSSDTFLFPIMKGTFRAGVAVQSQLMTPMRTLRFFADVWLRADPVETLPLIMLVGLFVREGSARRPLAAQWLGGFVSIALLVQGFSLSDAGNLARYDYGFVTASALLTWQTVATNAARPARGNTFAWAAPVALLVFALSAPLIEPGNRERERKMIATRLRDIDELLRRTVSTQPEPPIAGTYRRLQASAPAGARLLVMLDEPYFLDYARNEIWNLDLPGTASPSPGIPCFEGPEPVADYLARLGIRYVVFVIPERSAFLYSPALWKPRLYDVDEIWRVYSPYVVDVTDNLLALAATRAHLGEEAGMVVLDLQQRK